ncbi:MAG: ABC transporter substrate-binding protein [Candidatus Hydrothermia bacterium]
MNMKLYARLLVVCILLNVVSCVGQLDRSLTIGLSSKPRTLNPLKYKEVSITSIMCNVYEPLISSDEIYHIKPVLARYRERVDSITWCVYLRKGVKFHNGHYLTASDVVYSFYYPFLVDQSEYRTHGIFIDTIYALSDSIVVFKTKYPYDFLIREIIGYQIIPNGFDPDSNMPCGTGPYRVISNDDSSISMESWESYWGEEPFIEILKIVYIPDHLERINRLKEGAVDIIDYVPLEYQDTILKYAKLFYTPESAVRLIEFNLNVPPFDNRVFREDISMSIDRKKLVDEYYRGFSTPANQFFPAGVREHIDDLGPLEFDTIKARSIFANTVLRSPLVLDYSASIKALGDSIVNQLRRSGLNVVGNPLPSDEFWEKIKSGRSQFWLLSIVYSSQNAYSSLISYYHTLKPGTSFGILNRTSYSFKEVDTMTEEIMRVLDMEVRDSLVNLVHKKLLKDLPACPIVFERQFYGAKNDIIWTPSIDRNFYVSKIERR